MEIKKQVGLHFGLMVDPIKKQLSDQKLRVPHVRYYQKVADGINLLKVNSYISDSIARQARQRLLRDIAKNAFLIACVCLCAFTHAQPIPLGTSCLNVTKYDTSERRKLLYLSPSDTTDDVRISISGGLWMTYPYDPCKSQAYWPLQVSEPCDANPMHCRYCGKEIKVGESFCYVVMKATPGRKFADYIHVRCAIKRIR